MMFGGNDEIRTFILNSGLRFFTSDMIRQMPDNKWKHNEIYSVIKEMMFMNEIELIGKDRDSWGVYEVVK